ncbi:hypothetical protein XNC1_1501 [Xenorhabdus nematophila ATCC 19061]|uniref:Phage tail fibre protein N-terminal domain-containing protein n=4 Tax=Xenorhabdus nematophila TaxID=628 RepID=D3VBC5_XENNA|nr:phage tail protein [Xenorhabdus nematophila]CBJ89564.1 hypothetical protein XNC1_1501 [Xenorhabdus nematophila ATCC 19061]CEK22457.1 hypothetical protein XNC2_1463 [Xenorhabdus nematophila AN6/1]
MNTKYFALLTDSGTDKLEKAALSGTKLEITHMVVGDGGGSLPTPASSQSGLINERHRAEIDALAIVPGNPNQIIAEQIIPEGEGNWWVREIGLLDKDGTLIAVGNCVDLYKAESKEQTVRMSVTVNDSSQTNSINGFISGIATRNYVREKIRAHAESRNHPRATLKEQGFVALSNAVNSNNETQAATPKAIKTTYELADKAYQLATSISSTTKDKYVPLTRKINGKELKNDVALTASDVQAYSKPETDGLIQPVKLQAEEALKQAETANKNAGTAITQAESKVPLIRRINGKELNQDVELTASDVNAYSKAETDSLIQPVRALAEDAMQLAETANKNAGTAATQAESKVPLIRKINGKELTNDVDLAAADVNAYSKAETDNLIQPVKLQAEDALKLADSKVPLTRKINGKELTNDVDLAAADVNAYSKAETDNLIQPVKLQTEEAIKQAEAASKLADSKVPLTRKINGRELNHDVDLAAADINAYSKAETDNLIQPVKLQAEEALKLADSKVPLTRKINGKELNQDVELVAADINAYSKAETDNLIQPVKLQAEEAMKQAEAASKLADSKVPLTRKINGKELTNDVELIAADINAYSKPETDNLIQPVKAQAEEAIKQAEAVSKLADSKVPLTRKINGRELNHDVDLAAADVNAYSKAETDNLIQPVKLQAEEAIKQAEAASNLADSKVPLTRKINGKELNHDVDLAAADVNAYSKAETDSLIQPVKLQAEEALKLAESKVPLTRKINGRELNHDVDLAAADINAYSKAETDNLIQPVKLQAEEALKLADSKVPLTRKINGKELTNDVDLAAADINAYSKAETDSLIQPVKLQTEEAIKQAEAASKLADSKVPLTRKINGRELNHDVDLAAADVNAYSKAETDNLIQPVKLQTEEAIKQAEAASKLADSKVPLTRKINGKELNHDVDLAAADINAYSKAETDSLIQPVKLQTEEALKLAKSKVPLTRKINGKELTNDIDLAAVDVNAYSKAETDNLIQPVKLQTEEAIKQAEAASKLADSKVPLTRKINGKELTNDVELIAADINAYSKPETDNLIQPVKAQAEEAIKQAEAVSKLADSKVPLTRKINGRELNHDVDLAAADVNAYSKAETDNLIQPVKLQAEEAIKQAEAASNLADSKVPLTRKINGKELNHDVDLAAADINAYSKAETDSLIQPVKLQAEDALKLADSKVPLTRKINGKELNQDVELISSDVNAYSKPETDNLIQPVKLQTEEALKLAESKVPLTRKINGRELNHDVDLAAADVNAYSKAETDNLIQPVKLQTEEAIKQAEAASKLADSKVPLTRKINGKELNHDVDLAAADINAYSKAETDNLIQPVKLQTEEALKLADSKVPLTRKINGKELNQDVELAAVDVNAYSKAETDNLIQPVKLQTEEAIKQAEAASKLADSKVPLTRKINGKELTNDVDLAAVDVNAYSKAETDNLIQPVKLQTEEAIKQAEAASKLADSKVPLTRKINGRELNHDVDLAAADINAYSKAETDNLIQPVKLQAEEALKLADSKVPLTRKINGKELNQDVELVAADINAYSKAETDNLIQPVKLQAEEAMKQAEAASKLADSKVPLTRKINGKELNHDVDLAAADINAYSKAETDNLIQPVKLQAEEAIKLADSKVPLTRKINGKELTNDVELTASDINTYSKPETDNLIQPVKLQTEEAIKQAEAASNLADSKVPLTRKINGRELNHDVDLAAADVNAYSKAETDNLIQPVKLQAEEAIKQAEAASNLADSKVPLTRKINGKELNHDVDLVAADVNAYSKAETDSLIQPVKLQAEEALKLADSKVPLTRKINGKELNQDVELVAADINAYSKAETDNRIQPVKLQAEEAMKQAEAASKLADSKVPLTRKINGKELNHDVDLAAADINAYSKAETDNLIQPVKLQAEEAMKQAEAASKLADSKVPLTRRINGKELTDDVELTASDIHVYTTEEVDHFINEIRSQANEANNNANSRIPMSRTVNGKALSSDIKLIASDIGTYTKTEIDIKIEDIAEKAKEANNNADSRVPMSRTVNNKALSSDIKLIASDVDAYTRAEVNTRISKAEALANNANTNAEGRLAKSKNGSDIQDKQAFVRNIGLGELIGLDISSRLIGDEHTVIQLGDIFMVNGLATVNEPIGNSNPSVINGVTYYTHFYTIKLPITLPNGIISGRASIVGDNLDHQRPSHLADVKTQRNNANGIGLSQDTLTVSVMTPQLGWVPHFYYQIVGY